MFHHELADLRAADVSAIRVAGSRIENRGQIEGIVGDLNAIEWFSANHGGWASEVSLEVFLTTGRVLRYPIAYTREEGVVIGFTSSGGSSSWHYGHAFTPSPTTSPTKRPGVEHLGVLDLHPLHHRLHRDNLIHRREATEVKSYSAHRVGSPRDRISAVRSVYFKP